MAIKIALAGNPNCGKTTLFNALTGANQFVGNWPGVTVEKKEGKLKGDKTVSVIDLPGIYSLSPYTLEEVVARTYLVEERPDVILNIVDGTNLERNLYLTTQLRELGIPMVVAVNMMDIVKKNGDVLNIHGLSRHLGCPVVEISALKGTGVQKAAQEAVFVGRENGLHQQAPHRFGPKVEAALNAIAEKLEDTVPEEQKRYYAVKLFERDEKILEQIDHGPDVEQIIAKAEKALDDDSESIITNERYSYITSILDDCYVTRTKRKDTISDKIDRVVTNRFAALPIFAAVIFIVYYLSVTTIGAIGTDWMNDGVFGDGWFPLGIGQNAYEEADAAYAEQQQRITEFLSAAEDRGIDTAGAKEALAFDPGAYDTEAEAAKAEAAAEKEMDAFLALAEQNMLEGVHEVTDEDGQVESVEPITVAEFTDALAAEEPAPSDFGLYIPGIPVLIEQGLEAIHCVDWLQSLLLDGIVGGVGAVLGFVPQIFVLFFLLAILEGCGYMARIAFILDRIFRKFGLSGKSFIPMLIGTGCGIPGVMASRTIENERDRRMTIMTTTFMPCGAKMPIIALIAGAIFGGAWWVAPSAYFIGIAAIVVSGIILKKTKPCAGAPAPFVMELPSYHLPHMGSVLRSMWERGWSFVKKAGTIILLSTVVLWFLQGFGWTDGAFGLLEESGGAGSILSYIGKGFAWIFAPLGWGDWQAAVATVTGLIAKENVVGTFGVLYGFGEVAENGVEVWGTLAASFTGLSAMSFMIFNLLCAPCFAAIGAIRREMNSAKWTWFAIGYQCVFAYAISMIVYQLGTLFSGGGYDPIFTTAAILLVLLLVYLLLRPDQKRSRLCSAEAQA
ncbi:MAG: ferrous iron transporter B [Oscillospiraceae bacterium]|nr:ferrous iron transporter B [Oscillospiraceae bacterium]